MKIEADEKEYKDGFCTGPVPLIEYTTNKSTDLPNLQDDNNIIFLDRWEGAWPYLATLKWVRISSSGQVQDAIFPPKGHA